MCYVKNAVRISSKNDLGVVENGVYISGDELEVEI